MLNFDDIWMRLTTDEIGFFTHRRSPKIPAVPGVYGWFLPLRLKDNPQSLIALARRICCYDAGTRGVAKWKHEDAGFRWDPLRVELARQPNAALPTNFASRWNSVLRASDSLHRRFARALFISTVFSRPLYVGLTNNLASRYQQHITGSADANDFHNRFVNYMSEIGEALTLEQLLFVCIPLRRAPGEPDDLNRQQITLLEQMLKIVCQPVFDDR